METTGFRGRPVEVKTRVGARRRLKGRCAVCGGEMSAFLPGEGEPAVHSVKVGDETKKELQRAAVLLDLSQRAVVENLVREHLATFVTAELERYEDGGLLSWRERHCREDELARLIVLWTPPEPKPARSGRKATDPLAALGRLLGLGGKE